MAPLTPHWTRPSHPDVQEVIINDAGFTSKSFSKVALPPFAVFAEMAFPPCTIAEGGATYATVQIGPDRHLNLHSDLLYINHSCDPSLIFDTANFNILVGPKGIRPGDELTFFYPSTEWTMAQPFDCLCGASNCRGRISGASTMPAEHLAGAWLNGHIRALLGAKAASASPPTPTTTANTANTAAAVPENGAVETASALGLVADEDDSTARAMRAALQRAEEAAEAAREALRCYTAYRAGVIGASGSGVPKKAGLENGASNGHREEESVLTHGAAARRGVTSREMSGEMGGDTTGPAAEVAGAASGLVM